MPVFNDAIFAAGMIASHAAVKPLQDTTSKLITESDQDHPIRKLFGSALQKPETFGMINGTIAVAIPLAIHGVLGRLTGSRLSTLELLGRTAFSYFLGKADESLNLGFAPSALGGVNANLVKMQDQTRAILDKQNELGEKICHVTGRTTLKQLLRATNRTQYRVLSVFSGMPAYAHAAVVASVMCVTHLLLAGIGFAFIPMGRGLESVKQNLNEAWTDLRGAGLAVAGILYPLSLDPIVKNFIEREQWKLLPNSSN